MIDILVQPKRYRVFLPHVIHRLHRYLNNRAENSHRFERLTDGARMVSLNRPDNENMRGDAMQPDKNVHLQVPPDLVTEMEAAAKAENKTPDEWAAEAFARHLESQKWQKLVAFGHEHASAHGFKESDVNRLITESREDFDGAVASGNRLEHKCE